MPTGKLLRILLVEDDRNDADLLQLLMGKAPKSGSRFRAVEQLDQFHRRNPCAGECAVILSDYNLVPGFNGLDALKLYRQVGLPQVPFLLVSGTIGEEAAVACLKAGAHDYIMKRNLSRLIPALTRAVQDFADRAAHRAYQKRYEQIVERAAEGIWIMDEDGRFSFPTSDWPTSSTARPICCRAIPCSVCSARATVSELLRSYPKVRCWLN